MSVVVNCTGCSQYQSVPIAAIQRFANFEGLKHHFCALFGVSVDRAVRIINVSLQAEIIEPGDVVDGDSLLLELQSELPKVQKVSVEPDAKDSVGWTCANCTVHNWSTVGTCHVCKAAKVQKPPVAPGVKEPAGWTCPNCTVRNWSAVVTCHVCQAPYQGDRPHVQSQRQTQPQCLPQQELMFPPPTFPPPEYQPQNVGTWCQTMDLNSGKLYYYNTQTGESRWDNPLTISATTMVTSQLPSQTLQIPAAAPVAAPAFSSVPMPELTRQDSELARQLAAQLKAGSQ
jgi:hypothetical protein